MKIINRLLLSVSFKEEFVPWLKSKETDFDFSLDDLNREPSCFLIREPRSDKDYEDIIAQNYESIFGFVMDGLSDKTYKISREQFEKCFEIQVNEMIPDLNVDDPKLGYEDF